MEISYLSASQLIESEYNPRKLSQKEYDDIKESLVRFGFADPIIVNQHPDRKNIIVGGRQRWFIVRQEYEKNEIKFRDVIYHAYDIMLPCITGEWTRDRERELCIRLNKNTGSWDWQLLEELFTDEELNSWGFDEHDKNAFESLRDSSGEIDVDELLDPDHITCPSCGFKFEAQTA